MKRAAAVTAFILAAAAAAAQIPDAALLRGASFDAPSKPDSTTLAARAIALSCPFVPDNRTFFREAVHEAGFFPAVIFTADRLTRSGRIGTAQHHHFSEDGRIHEGLEAYMPRRAFPKESPALTYHPSVYPASGTAGSVSKDFGFVDYLIGNNMHQEAVTLLTRTPYQPSDTLNYLRGWANYSAKRLEAAASDFDLVPRDSPFYDKSLFFNVISNAHIGNYARSAMLLDSYDGQYRELKSLEQAGIALLDGRPEDFLKASEGFTFSQYSMTEAERTLQGIYNERYYGKAKSPAVAALASAAVPGLGKVYAGEAAEGVASFLTVGALAAITAENWVKYGVKDWKTILFGTVGAVFYIGNVYGSYVSVSIHNNDLKNVQDTAILYHIHIPLRSVFQ